MVTNVLLSGQNMPCETQGVLIGKCVGAVSWWLLEDRSLLE